MNLLILEIAEIRQCIVCGVKEVKTDRYILKENYIPEDNGEDTHYIAETMISLRPFSYIAMKLKNLFEKVDGVKVKGV